MSTNQEHSKHRKFHGKGLAIAGVAVACVGGLLVASLGTAQAVSSVGLGTADSFVVLAGGGVTNTGPTTLNGDIGTFPTTTITNTGTMTVNGTNHAGDSVTQGAKNDLVTAYNSAAGQASNQTISADLGGMTLVSGVYTSASSLGLTGTLTLDAAGNQDAVFVFQAGSTLDTASGSRVSLINGAQACNVFWQVGSSATVETGSTFRGTIMALTSITLKTGATIDGRALARNGAVTLDTNTITRSACNSTSTNPPPAYAANIGPLAKGLVCPWGGEYNNAGLCVGTSANSLTNPSATPTTSPIATATPTATVVPVVSAPTPTSTIAPPRRPATTPGQVPRKPSGAVGTGDSSIG